jgi:hypothetical protein
MLWHLALASQASLWKCKEIGQHNMENERSKLPRFHPQVEVEQLSTPAMIWGSGGIAPHSPNLSPRWKWVVSITSQLIYPLRKIPWYWMAGWMGPRAGLDSVENRSLLLLQGIEPWFLSLSAHGLFSVPSELSWLFALTVTELTISCYINAQ